MQTNLKFDISLGRVNGEGMSFEIFANSQKIYRFVDNGQPTVTVSFPCVLPAEISIKVTGKGPLDTIIDESGIIVEDKFVKIERFFIDGLPIKQWILESRLFKFESDNGTIRFDTNVFSYNGTATMSLQYDSSFRSVLNWLKT